MDRSRPIHRSFVFVAFPDSWRINRLSLPGLTDVSRRLHKRALFFRLFEGESAFPTDEQEPISQ